MLANFLYFITFSFLVCHYHFIIQNILYMHMLVKVSSNYIQNLFYVSTISAEDYDYILKQNYFAFGIVVRSIKAVKKSD
jgi:hypothetical protein